MKKLSDNIDLYLAKLSGSQSQARINIRARQVRERYKQAIESVYRDSAPLFLQHTNNVYIMNKNNVRTLIVYVDESIFAAELNAQRELIKLKLLEGSGEHVDAFEILVSRGNYKHNHPYETDGSSTAPAYRAIPLSPSEQNYVETTVSGIEGRRLRTSLEKAMTASLELNKAENYKNDSNST